ncbi:MAG: hypothetical protein MHMPM18_000782 [Marteilia pararefringens]
MYKASVRHNLSLYDCFIRIYHPIVANCIAWTTLDLAFQYRFIDVPKLQPRVDLQLSSSLPDATTSDNEVSVASKDSLHRSPRVQESTMQSNSSIFCENLDSGSICAQYECDVAREVFSTIGETFDAKELMEKTWNNLRNSFVPPSEDGEADRMCRPQGINDYSPCASLGDLGASKMEQKALGKSLQSTMIESCTSEVNEGGDKRRDIDLFSCQNFDDFNQIIDITSDRQNADRNLRRRLSEYDSDDSLPMIIDQVDSTSDVDDSPEKTPNNIQATLFCAKSREYETLCKTRQFELETWVRNMWEVDSSAIENLYTPMKEGETISDMLGESNAIAANIPRKTERKCDNIENSFSFLNWGKRKMSKSYKYLTQYLEDRFCKISNELIPKTLQTKRNRRQRARRRSIS